MTPISRREAMRNVAGAAMLVPLAVTTTQSSPEQPIAAQARLPRVRVHPDGHHLQTDDGRPFFWLGDTAWFVMHRATLDEASYYLRVRQGQGFNVIQTMLLPECDSMRTPSAWGELPFDGADPLRPREAYFGRIDAFLSEAASLGLYVALVALWGDKVTAPWGDGPRVFTTDNLPAARRYGEWLGRRYRDFTNVIWIMGGDRPPRLGGHPANWCDSHGRPAGFPPDHDWTPIWRTMAEGLIDGAAGNALLTYHPQGGEASTSVYLHHEPWLHINSMQSGHGGGHDQPVWAWITRDYRMEPPKPTFDSEPNYEDHPYNPWPQWDPATGYFRDHDVRKQCYRSVFAGGCGVTYGHHAVWQWACRRHPVINFPDRDWVDALHRPGARQITLLRRLLESRPFFTRIPDQGLIAGDPGAGPFHLRATRDVEATYAMVYFPQNDQGADLDLSVFEGRTLRPYWYDTRTGFARPAGTLDGGGKRTFVSPSFGPDWVLVLDDAAAGYPPPGLGRG